MIAVVSRTKKMRASQFVFPAFYCLLGMSAAAQTAQPAPVDANEFMKRAAEATSLIEPDMKPWHLRAKYQQFQADGNQQGTVEIWWAAPEEFKIAYTSPSLNTVEYRQGKETFFTGDTRKFFGLVDTVKNVLTHPLPEQTRLGELNFVEKDLTAGGISLQCYFGGEKDPANQPREFLTDSKGERTTLSPVTWSYCFKGTLPAVRMAEGAHLAEGAVDSQQVFNSTVRLHDHYLARSIRWDSHGKPWLQVDVEQDDPTLTIDEAELKPPPDAKVAPPRMMDVSAGLMAGHILSQQKPTYPDQARRAHVQGTVVLQAVIDKQGNITDLRVIGGPTLLQGSAMEAVKTWRYRPYVLNGEPVEVETQINVVYSMGYK